MTSGELKLGAYHVRMTDKLGQGTFGVVYEGKHMASGERIAVKQCEIKNDSHGSMAMIEIKNFQQLENHPNIVHLFDFHYQKNSFWLVMEFCDAGDLVHYMKSTHPDIDSQVNIMYQCASAIAFMHSRPNPVVHRDIKPANIMMKTEGRGVVVKVTDFGLSKITDAPDVAQTILFTTAAGTPGFMAPEFFNKEPYSKSVDVFALGLVYVAMINFRKGDKELIPVIGNILLPIGALMAQAHEVKGMPMPEIAPVKDGDSAQIKAIKKLVKSMTGYDRKERITMSKAEEELAKLGGSQAGRAPVAKSSGSRMGENVEHVPRVQKSKPGSIGASVPSSGSEESVDVGFMLLKEALDQALKDKMKTEDQEKYKREMKEIPFTSLLKQVLGQDKEADKFKVGDKVVVEREMKRAREMQKGHGEWNDHMRHYLGREGTVKETVLHVIKVQFDDGQVWSYNPELLYHPGEQKGEGEPLPFGDKKRDIVAGMFKRYDVVQVPEDEEVVKVCQKKHGGWNPKMKRALGVKGIVNRVDSDGDVYVECVNGDNWTFNPEILVHADMSKEKLEAGDFVLVLDDRTKVKKLQEDHGGWVESMAGVLGKSGVVQSVADHKAKVEIRGRSFIWNQDCLKLVAKGEEMMKAVLKKKMGS